MQKASSPGAPPFGLVGDITIGIIGAFIAGLLFPRLGIDLGGGILSAIIAAAIGACVLGALNTTNDVIGHQLVLKRAGIRRLSPHALVFARAAFSGQQAKRTPGTGKPSLR